MRGQPSSRAPAGGLRRGHHETGGHFFFFWYIASMRWVTRKPPKMLMDAKTRATKPSPRASTPPSLPTSDTPTASSAPTTTTEEIALVTDISGVCSAGVTDHTT